MDKLEFGSLQKFKVSLGIVLMAGPFVLLYGWCTRDLKPIISLDEYSNLSDYSREILDSARVSNSIMYIVLFAVAVVGVIVGGCFLYSGFKDWSLVQKVADEKSVVELNKIKYESELKKRELSSQGEDEVLTGKLENMIMRTTAAETANQSIGGPEPQIDAKVLLEEVTLDNLMKGIGTELEAEKLLYQCLSKSLSDEYLLALHVRNSDDGKASTYDIVAFGSEGKPDIVYCVHYGQGQPKSEFITMMIESTEMQATRYLSEAKHSCVGVLAIVTDGGTVRPWRIALKGYAKTIHEKGIGVSLYALSSGNIESVQLVI